MVAIMYGADDRMFAPAPVAVQTTAYSALANSFVPCNTTSAGFTVTLPLAPVDRAVVGVKLVAGTNTLTIATGGGSDVFDVAGGSTSITLTALDQATFLQYSATAAIWYQVANYTSGGSGAVSSVFGRTGAVVAVANDYSFSEISGTATIAQGGTGQTSASAAFNALSPLTTLGDVLAAGASGVDQRVAGNTTTTKNFLVQTGTGSVSALPGWGTIAAADVPTLNQSTTGTAAGLSTTLAIASGGTGQTTQQAAINALTGTQASGEYLRSNGTNATLSALAAADLTGTVAVAHGGTGFTQAPVVSTGATTVTGVTVATALASGQTLAASTLAAGQVYHFFAWGVMSTTVDTQTFTFNLDWGGVGGTSLLTWGASNPNGSATVSNVSWSTEFTIVANTATSLAVSGTLCMNFYFSSYQQQVTTVANSSSEQFVVGVTPSAAAASITCNGFVSERRW